MIYTYLNVILNLAILIIINYLILKVWLSMKKLYKLCFWFDVFLLIIRPYIRSESYSHARLNTRPKACDMVETVLFQPFMITIRAISQRSLTPILLKDDTTDSVTVTDSINATGV